MKNVKELNIIKMDSDEELVQVTGAGFGDTTEPIICPVCKKPFYNKIKYGYHMASEHYTDFY